jgi:hypothetical protein
MHACTRAIALNQAGGLSRRLSKKPRVAEMAERTKAMISNTVRLNAAKRDRRLKIL